MEETDLAVMAKAVKPRRWRVLDVPEVEPRWARRICKLIRSPDYPEVLRLQWVNGEIGEFERRHVEPATVVERLAYVAKQVEWETINRLAQDYTAMQDRENEWISGGERVRFCTQTRAEAMQDEIDSWANGLTTPEIDEHLYTLDAWEPSGNWYGGVVVCPPREEGGEFVIRIDHGVGCDHAYGCGEETTRSDAAYAQGNYADVPWYCVRRLQTTPKDE